MIESTGSGVPGPPPSRGTTDSGGVMRRMGGAQRSLNPHPEERHLRRVSKDEATGRAAWFETAQERLLTMRNMDRIAGCGLLNPHPEERRLRRVSKDEATGRAAWFETAQERLLTMRNMDRIAGYTR